MSALVRARGLDDENNVSLSRGKSDSASDIPLSSDLGLKIHREFSA